jgi:hypothetical protein
MSENRETMGEVSHTHPYTGETFGTVYRRGPAVADGGSSDPAGTDEDCPEGVDPTTGECLGDVDHTPPHGDTPNDVWERGVESTKEVSGSEDGVGVGDE